MKLETETRRWKRTFIRNFMRQMTQHILKDVDKMPAEWDGHEIREYIIEEFDRERTHLMRTSRAKRMRYRSARYSSGL